MAWWNDERRIVDNLMRWFEVEGINSVNRNSWKSPYNDEDRNKFLENPEFFIERMEGGDENMRGWCVSGLYWSRNIRAIEPLIGALKDPASSVRGSAASKLGNFDQWDWAGSLASRPRRTRWHDPPLRLGRFHSQVVEALIEVVKDDEDLYVRTRAVNALFVIHDQRAIEPIIEVLRPPHEFHLSIPESLSRLWWESIRALGRFGDERAVEPLIDVFQYVPAIGRLPWEMRGTLHQNWTIRSAAAKALGEIGDERAIEVLIEALNDRCSASTQSNAVWALSKIADESIIELIPHYQISYLKKNGMEFSF